MSGHGAKRALIQDSSGQHHGGRTGGVVRRAEPRVTKAKDESRVCGPQARAVGGRTGLRRQRGRDEACVAAEHALCEPGPSPLTV